MTRHTNHLLVGNLFAGLLLAASLIAGQGPARPAVAAVTGAESAAPAAQTTNTIPLPSNSSASAAGAAFIVRNTGAGAGILGRGTTKRGVYGYSDRGAEGVFGEALGVGAAGVRGYANNGLGSAGVRGQSTKGRGVWGSSVDWQGVLGESVNQAGVVGRSQKFHAGFFHASGVYASGVFAFNDGGGTGVYGEGKTGIGTWGVTNSGTAVRGEARANGRGVWGSSDSWQGVYGTSNTNAGVVGESQQQYGGFFVSRGQFAGIYANGANSGIAAYLDGRTQTKVLEVLGGSDLAEKFEVQGDVTVEPGTLMVIDKANPGKLKPSETPYDGKVMGIISGAGGVNPGMVLEQEGVLEGDHVVAIAGRVYVKAEALSGPIEPGDLLTTSAIPGHAMHAADRDRAYGTVIGKALTGLEIGTGLVLVVVNLQ